MKKLLAAALLAIQTSTALAAVQYDSSDNSITIDGAKSGMGVVIKTSPEDGCEHIFFLMEQSERPTINKLYFEMRVDRRQHWQTTMPLEHYNGVTFVRFIPNDQLITDMRRGSTLRLRIPQRAGGNYYNSFSMVGFSRAIGKAKAACIPPGKYFNEASDAEYFL